MQISRREFYRPSLCDSMEYKMSKRANFRFCSGLMAVLFVLTIPQIGWSAPIPQTGRTTNLKIVTEAIDKAGEYYKKSEYRKSRSAFKKAKREFQKLLDKKGTVINEDIEKQYQRLAKAHSLLEKKGFDLGEMEPLHADRSETSLKNSSSGKASAHNDNYEQRGDPFAGIDSSFYVDSYYYIDPAEASSRDSRRSRSTRGTTSQSNDTGNSRQRGTTGEVSFINDVVPILNNRCGQCHVQQSKGGFNASSFAELLDSGMMVSGSADESAIVQVVEQGIMPPRGPLTEKEIDVLRSWIDQGSQFDGINESEAIGPTNQGRGQGQNGNSGQGRGRGRGNRR